MVFLKFESRLRVGKWKRCDFKRIATLLGQLLSRPRWLYTEAGVLSLEAGVLLTEAGVLSTEAGVLSTEAGVLLTEAGVLYTEAGVL